MNVHEKYGLATDVKSIKERIEKGNHFQIVWQADFPMDFRSDEIHNEAARLRAADLALLCSLAEKGERAESAEKELAEIKARAEETINNIGNENIIDTPYTVSTAINFIIKGETK